MTAIQILEQLAVNPSYKRDLVAGKGDTSPLAVRAQHEIADLLKEQSKIWCALLPARDAEPSTEEAPRKELDDDADADEAEEKRSDS